MLKHFVNQNENILLKTARKKLVILLLFKRLHKTRVSDDKDMFSYPSRRN